MSGMDVGYTLARLTRHDGKVSTIRGGCIALTPIIESGREYVEGHSRFREPDRFVAWEIELVLPWLKILALGIRSRRWSRSAFEFWTKVEEPGPSPYGHVRWVFPYVQWQRHGLRRWHGVTHEGAPVTYDDMPDSLPITQGGWWKVKEVPGV